MHVTVISIFYCFLVDFGQFGNSELNQIFVIYPCLIFPVVVANETHQNHKQWCQIEVNDFVNVFDDTE